MSSARATIIGLMSGTSADGVDAALVEFDSKHSFKVKATHYQAYPQHLSDRINRLAHYQHHQHKSDQQVKAHIESQTELDEALVDIYTESCENLLELASVSSDSVTAIANHGQTIIHRPNANPAFSIQLGNGQALANRTGINTITQFRQADLALGGQGAPLMPAFHDAINPFDRNKTTTIFLNLGGIGNLSILGSTIFGFDTGPANTLLNQWVSQKLQQPFDKDGVFAASGTVDQALLTRLLQDPYFAKPIPKSTGPDYFNLDWLKQNIDNLDNYKAEDIQATLLQLTIETIADALSLASITSGSIYACGGGTNNSALIQGLKKRLSQFEVKLTDELGLPADWVEAVGFAWLGYCKLCNIESNIPDVTGANKKTVLGELFTPK